MAELKEIWMDVADTSSLTTHRAHKVVIRKAHGIHFLRGAYEFSPPGETEEWRESPVISALDKTAVKYMHSHGSIPSLGNLLLIKVEKSILSKPEITLEAGGSKTTLAMSDEDGQWQSQKRILFVYGDANLGGAAFDGIAIFDITKSDAVGFEILVKCKAGLEERQLGIIDLLVKDPEDGKYRTARCGIFKTRTPEFKLVCPRLGANNIQVFLDDGDDNSEDSLDITRLVDPSGEVTQCEEAPLALEESSPKVTGHWDDQALRSRIYDEPPEENKSLGLFLFGENRIRIAESGENDLFTAHFLLYLNDEEAIPGTFYGEEFLTTEQGEIGISKNHLLLDFKDSAKDADIGPLLQALNLRPQGISGEMNIVQVAPHAVQSGEELSELVTAINGYGIPVLEEASLDLLATRGLSPANVLERYPEALQSDFNAAGHDFTNAFQWYFHHFYMHTFPAHRLIDRVRFPEADPPSVTLEGTHYEVNKTFILPTSKDSIFLMLQARRDHPQRKIAVFGHTDSTGADAHNNSLSRLRAETAHAILVKNPDTWLRRLDGTALVTETAWGTREIQFMLKTLGLYTGVINGTNDAATRQASRNFLASVPLPDVANGALDNPARRALIQAYMNNLVDTALAAADFFQDAAGNPALFGCGEAFPFIANDTTNGQNRRVTFVLRITAPAPVDLTQEGATVPYRAWISPEAEAAAQAEDDPPFIVACADTGFGNSGSLGISDDYSNDQLNAHNRIFVKGKRIVQPTLMVGSGSVNHRVFADGDLSRVLNDPATGALVSMSDIGQEHGSGVMSCLAGDGVGDDVGALKRTAQQVVLGTGKNVKVRPIKHFSADLLSFVRRYQILASDTRVKIVSSSFIFTDMTLFTATQANQLRNSIRNMINRGKLYFIAANNVNPGILSRRDVARTEGGFVAPRRNQKRSSFSGGNAFRRNIATIGATTHVQDAGGNHAAGIAELPTSFTFLGDEVNVSAPGNNIRIVAPTGLNLFTPFGGVANVNGVTVGNTDGTSFSTPMTAGIAAEMMLVNPKLQETANLPMVIEMLEATADPLPSLATGTNQGLFLPGAANADPQLVAGDLTGFRRVNFWKAILAAVNDGLASESTIPNPAGAGTIVSTTHFDLLTAKDHAATTWYGFEIRTRLPDCTIWLKRANGTFVRLGDSGAALPGDRITGTAWRRTQDHRAPVGHVHAGFVLPAFPFAGAAPAPVRFWFMAQFSILREELARFAEIRIYGRDIDPLTSAHANAPAFGVLDLSQIVRMRNPKAITAAERGTNAKLDQIFTHVEEFDDFVFQWTIDPQSHEGFAIVHSEGANVGEPIVVFVFALDKFGNVKTDFPSTSNVTLSHTGTNGINGPPQRRGVFFNGNPIGASTVIQLINGSNAFILQNFSVENFRLRATDGVKNDNGTSPVINVGPAGALSAIRIEVTHFDGRSVDSPVPKVGQRLRYLVTVLDNQERAKTDFTGTVELRVVEGQMGSDVAGGAAPFKRGVHVADTTNDAFSAAKFRHTFVAADRGVFGFSVINYTTGNVVLQAVSGGVSASARSISVRGGALDHFDAVHPASVAVGNGINLELRAKDLFGNLIRDFEGIVVLNVLPAGMAGAVDGAGVKSGVFIGETQTAADDRYEFVHTDGGVHTFRIVAHSAGNFQIGIASAGIGNRTTSDITVNGASAPDRFAFVVAPSQRRGVRFTVTVRALDVGGNILPNFTGNVQLVRATGPGATIFLSPHAFVAGDNGQFTFDARANANGSLVLRAISGAVRTDSPAIIVS